VRVIRTSFAVRSVSSFVQMIPDSSLRPENILYLAETQGATVIVDFGVYVETSYQAPA
jgi:hypothetical protein